MIAFMIVGALIAYVAYTVGRTHERRMIEKTIPDLLVKASATLQSEMNRRAVEAEHRV